METNDRAVVEIEPGVFEGIIVKPGVPNANGRVYSKEAAESVVAELRAHIAERRAVVFGGEWRSKPLLKDVEAIITDVRDDDHVRIRVVPMANERGGHFVELARRGMLGFNGAFIVDSNGTVALSHVTMCSAVKLVPEAKP